VTAAIRRLTPADAPVIAELRATNRAWLEPSQPDTDDGVGTATVVGAERWIARPGYRFGILDGGEIVGAIVLSNLQPEPMRSAILGYWVARDRAGRGLATLSVAEMLELAFGEFGLHRVEAGTRVENVASQRVLEKNGFERYGLARKLLRINGEWRDHVLFERIAD
jgi:ribosomal-protein-alanine N-acetyltransferase